jgi:hypothetical protein
MVIHKLKKHIDDEWGIKVGNKIAYFMSDEDGKYLWLAVPLEKVRIRNIWKARKMKELAVTRSIRNDKELYETIMNTNENSELYGEEDLNW